jgi:hypothetical protein
MLKTEMREITTYHPWRHSNHCNDNDDYKQEQGPRWRFDRWF